MDAINEESPNTMLPVRRTDMEGILRDVAQDRTRPAGELMTASELAYSQTDSTGGSKVDRELQVATRRSRAHEGGGTLSDNASYEDMLAAVIAAANLTEHDRDRPHARRLLATVQSRLHELKPVAHDKLKAYGFGNAAGHAIFDSASGAIDSWIRKIDLNASIATDEFVARWQSSPRLV